MKIDLSLKTALVVALTAVAPAFCAADSTLRSESQSFDPTYYHRARTELNDMRQDAQRVANRVAVLKGLANGAAQSDWETYGRQLQRIKANVNDMGRRLQWLQSVDPLIPPGDRQAAGNAAPLVRYMAANTNDAILYLNTHKGDFFAPSFQRYTNNLRTEAVALNRTIDRGERLAYLDEHGSYMQRNLGMTTIFGK